MYARIENKRCAELVLFNPNSISHPSVVWVLVDEKYYVYADDQYLLVQSKIVPPSAEYLGNQIKAKISAHRWYVQNAGVKVNEVHVNTTEYDVTMLTNAIRAIEKGQITDTDWKGSTGWQTVTVDDLPILNAFDKAVSVHIRDAFRRQHTLSKKIDDLVDAVSGDVFDQLLALDWKLGWPGDSLTGEAVI